MRESDYPKVHRRGAAVMVILLLLLLLLGAFAPAAMAADVWPDCTFNCNAQDFNVDDVYLGDASGNPLPPCNPGDKVAAHIWIKVDANTARYAIILLANITIEGVLEESFWDEIPAGRCVADAIPGGISYVYIALLGSVDKK